MLIRDKIQAEIVESIKKNNYNCILDVIPRTGKSKALIDALKLIPDKKILISAPYLTVLDSWRNEFVKWDYNGDVTLTTAISIATHTLDDYDLLVIDECHLLSPAQLAYIKPSKARKVLMSGTISKLTLKSLQDSLKLPLGYSYGIKQGIKNKIVSDVEINIIGVPLDDTKKYIEGGNKTNRFLTTEKQNYDYNSKKLRQAFAIAKKTGKQDYVKLVAGTRARAVYAYTSKQEWTKKLLDKLKDKTLVFTMLTSNDLCEYKHDSKTKEDNLSKFIEGEIDTLQVVKMASVGVTIKDLKCCVFHQLTSSSETGMQSIMRACNYMNDEKATIYIFCYQDTQDEVWVNKAISMFPQDKINYIHYKNI
jgi:superfamily II DNA or RNA helicase